MPNTIQRIIQAYVLQSVHDAIDMADASMAGVSRRGLLTNGLASAGGVGVVEAVGPEVRRRVKIGADDGPRSLTERVPTLRIRRLTAQAAPGAGRMAATPR